MSKTAIVVFQASLQGDNITSWLAPVSYTLPNSPAEHDSVQLQVGNNTIAIPIFPSTARYVGIYPPLGSSNFKTLYLNSPGTNGWQLDPQYPTWLSIPASGSNYLVLVSTFIETVDLYWL